MNTFMGLGDVANNATTTQQPSVWDKIGNVITKVVQPAANVYSQVTNKPAVPGSVPTTYLPTPPANQQPGYNPPPPEEKTNWTKYLVIGGVGAAALTGIYFATRKKKK